MQRNNPVAAVSIDDQPNLTDPTFNPYYSVGGVSQAPPNIVTQQPNGYQETAVGGDPSAQITGLFAGGDQTNAAVDQLTGGAVSQANAQPGNIPPKLINVTPVSLSGDSTTQLLIAAGVLGLLFWIVGE